MEWVYGVLLIACAVMVVTLQFVECRSRYWLSGFMAFLSAYLGLILLDAQDYYISPRLYFVLLSIIFLPGPLLLGYVGHISTRSTASLKDFALCFLPIICVLTAPELLGDVAWYQLASVDDYQADSYTQLFNMISVMAGGQTFIYLIASLRLIITMREDWTSYQSKTLPRTWYKVLEVLAVLVVVTVLQVISALINPAGDEMSIGDIAFVMLVLYFLLLAFSTAYGRQQDILILQQGRETETSDVGYADALAEKGQWLVGRVKEDQLYLSEDLSLAAMADHLGMTTHKLSETINKAFQLNFYDFINEFRVKHAAKLLVAEPGRPITDIYYSSGFTAKSTFYNSFKKIYGCTPTQYRKRELDSSYQVNA